MALYARLADDVVVEIVDLPDTITVPDPGDEGSTIIRPPTPEDVYHPDLAAAFRPATTDVEIGWRRVGSNLKAPDPEVIDLPVLKDRLKAEIDAAAEAERLKYITPGAGQAMTYARKVEQARAAQAAEDPEPGDYPLLAASIGIDGSDVLTVASTVLEMDAAWERIGAAIEAARLNGKRAVDLAETVEAARATEVTWPAP